MRRAGWIGLVVAALLVPWLTMSSARAASHYVLLTIRAAPNPAAGTTVISYIGTATPIGGPFTNVRVTMSPINGGGCTYRCDWSYPSLTRKVTFQVWAAFSQGPVWLDLTGCDGTCLNARVSVTVRGPTDRMTLTYTPAGTIRPGERLHFTIHGSTDVGPVSTDLHTIFAAGLAAPTNLSPGAQWAGPPYGYIDDGATLNRTGSYSFDAVVTAHLGGSIKLIMTPFNDPISRATGVPNTVILHVGPPPTPKPKPTPMPTQRPRPTAVASAGADVSPSSDASATPMAGGSSDVGSTSSAAQPSDSSLAIVATAGPAASAEPSPTVRPTAPSGAPGVVVVTLGSLTGMAVVGLLAAARWRRLH